VVLYIARREHVRMTRDHGGDRRERFLASAKRALGSRTTRATTEEALRSAAAEAEGDRSERAGLQLRYLRTLAERGDPAVMASDRMWR
jgi:hypothetical protein